MGHSPKAEGDQYSDIEFWLFFDDHKLKQIDPIEWINEVAPTYYVTINGPGAHVGLFRDNLIRGEFHFAAASAMDTVRSWPSAKPPASARMVIIDAQASC